MHDRIDGVVAENSTYQVGVAGFADDKITVKYRRPESRTQIVEDDDTLTGFAELSDDVTTDIASAPGDEYGVICHSGFRLVQVRMTG